MFINFNKINFLIKPINVIQEINSILLLYVLYKKKNYKLNVI